MQIAEALYEIREGKLYADEYKSFSEFIENECDYSRPRVYQLIKAVEGQKKLSNKVDNSQPVNSKIAVEIASIPDEKVAEVVEKATEGGTKPMTAAAVKRVKGELMPPEPSTEPEVYDVWEEVEPPEPKESKVDQFRKLRSLVKQHANQMIRAVDDMQAIRCNPGTHKKLLALFEQIHSLVDGWPE